MISCVHFIKAEISDLGSLELILGDADFKNSTINNLKNLEIIGDTADFSYSDVRRLGKLRKIFGDALFENSDVRNLAQLEYIGGDALFTADDFGVFGRKSKISSLGNLKTIGGEAIFENICSLRDFGKLEQVGKGHFTAYDLISGPGGGDPDRIDDYYEEDIIMAHKFEQEFYETKNDNGRTVFLRKKEYLNNNNLENEK